MELTGKKSVRSRWWLFTLWADKITLDDIRGKLVGYDAYGGQLEKCPTTGKLHYQFVLYHHNAISNITLDNMFKGAGSYIKGYGSVAMVKYCEKSKTAYPVDDPVRFKHGLFPFELGKSGAGSSNLTFKNLHADVVAGASVDDLLLTPAGAWHNRKLRDVEDLVLMRKWSSRSRSVNVSYLWGVSGSGKTLGVRAKHGDENIYRITDYHHPFDNYRGQPVLVLDEYHHQFDFEYLKNLTDTHPLQLSARYSNKWAAFNQVYIISNYPLESQYPDYLAHHPLSWAAFLRRINEVIEYTKPLDDDEVQFLLDKLGHGS